MKLSCSVFWVILLNLTFTIASFAVAEEAPPKSNATETKENLLNRLRQYRSFLPQLSEVKQPHTSAELLTQQLPTNETNPNIVNDEILIEVEGARDIFPATSTPVYEITEEEIQKQRPNSLAEVLRNLPGFAINDVGFGADIHTGTFYRGSSINQSVFLLNGRPINTNISTYHGGFDLNSIPVDAIERVELSSGTSSTLYGSEAFGGVVNIITKQGSEIPRFNGLAEFGSYDRSNYRASYGGTFGPLRLNFGYEEFSAENRYPVPEGAANRDAEGLLFNGDTAINNYYGSAIVVFFFF